MARPVATRCCWSPERFVAIKTGIRELPPLLFAGLRFDLAAVVLVAYVAMKFPRSTRLPRIRGDMSRLSQSCGTQQLGQDTRKNGESIGFGQAIAGWFGGEVETIFILSVQESSHFTRQK